MMVEKPTRYDDSIELELNALLCSLDENPKVCVEPAEASKYLNISLYESEEGFQKRIEVLVSKFLDYLNGFVKTCINDGDVQAILLPTISRLLAQYQQAHYTFTHSPLRLEWKQYSQHFIIPNPTDDYNITKQQNYTRQAYRFFHKASSIQLFFIIKMIDTLTVILNANGIDTTTESQTNTKDENKQIQYRFTVQKETKKHVHNILQSIHKELKKAGYINCSSPDFKNIFTAENPKHIIWLKPYSHLTYLIKRFGEHILTEPKSPSNYSIAIHYFFDSRYGVYFKPKKVRHDSDPNPNSMAFLDRVIDNAVNSFM